MFKPLKKLVGLVILLTPFVAYAQSGKVAGKITDAGSGVPLPGATIRLEPSRLGAASDGDGRFVISRVPDGEYTLSVSFVGYRNFKRAVTVRNGGEVVVNVALQEDPTGLDEVVVTGLAATNSKAIAPVATSKVDVGTLTQDKSFSNVNQMLAGKVSGVTVASSSGNVAGGLRFDIRSGGGLFGGGQPLIIVDGARILDVQSLTFGTGGQSMGTLVTLNPDDIQNIEVLKGPAGGALYGTSGANGVVIITTKSGKKAQGSGGLRVEYKGITGYNERQKEYTEDMAMSYKGHNALYIKGPIQQHTLSAAGSTGAINYFTSFDQRQEEGILRNNGLDRTSFRANFEAYPSDKFTIRVSSNFSNSKADLPQNDNNILGYLGNTLLYGPNLTTGARGDWRFTDSLAVESIQTQSEVNRFIGSVGLDFNPFQGLSLKATMGFDGFDQRDDQTFPANFRYSGRTKGERNVAMRRYQLLNYDATARYSTAFSNIKSNTSVGLTAFASTTSNFFITKQNFATELTTNVGAGADFIGGNEGFGDNREAGVFARQELTFKDAILVYGGARMDFASSVGRDAPNAIYPQAGVSVNFERLGILPSFVNLLKLRTAYGASGVLPGSLDGYDRLWTAVNSGYGGAGVLALIGNAGIKPESLQEIEAGLDAEFLGSRLGLEVTGFYNFATNAIIGKPNAPSTGQTASTVPFNVGKLNGWGVESKIYGTPLKTQNAVLDLTMIWNYNDNEVKDIGDSQPIYDGFSRNVIKAGLTRSAFFLPIVIGANFDANGKYLSPKFQTDAKGVQERVYVGRPTPLYNGSFTANLNLFKRVNVYVLTDWALGHSVFNGTQQFHSNPVYGNNKAYNELRAQLGLVTIPGITALAVGSNEYKAVAEKLVYMEHSVISNYIQPADYFKIREVSVSYNIGQLLAKSTANKVLKGATLSVAGRNLWTLNNSKFKGADVEINGTGARSLGRGQDFLTLQTPRQYYATLSLGF